MEFDKNRVYTALNADELKIGSRVVVADNITDLKKKVSNDECSVLSNILSGDWIYRFEVNTPDRDAIQHCLAYLVSEPEENKLKWQDVKIGDTLYRKSNPSMQFLVTAKSFNANIDRHIYVVDTWIKDTVLADDYAKVGVLENEHAEVGDEDEDD